MNGFYIFVMNKSCAGNKLELGMDQESLESVDAVPVPCVPGARDGGSGRPWRLFTEDKSQ